LPRENEKLLNLSGDPKIKEVSMSFCSISLANLGTLSTPMELADPALEQQSSID